MVWEVMDEVWRTSIDVTAACAMLQMYNKTHSTSRLNFDTLTLAGLVHNIGALPVLTGSRGAAAFIYEHWSITRACS